jgi:2-keto-4-pentenoate hydratase/2-oxohepta-3-ene-1,7-dioic acid hydratase in catechol pathway
VRGRSGYVDVADATGQEEFSSITGLLQAGPFALDVVRSLEARDGREASEDEFAAAVPDAGRILCLGVNYQEHAAESGQEAPTWPEAFLRGPDSLTGPFSDLCRPALSEKFDFEGELGVVIGKGGRYIAAEDAFDAIAGFVVLNDASVRDWQHAASQWTAGKNFDGSMPIGPEVVTPDEVDISDLALTTTLNGEVMQSARTSQMINSVPSAIEFLSSFTTLRPGDVIATGTPGGVGGARKPPVWLRPGDVIEVSVEGLGAVRNRVVAEDASVEDWRWHPRPR